MEDVSKMQIFYGCTNSCMTNMTNHHTCAVGSVDAILPAVLLTDSHLLELPRDVVGGASVGIPVGIDTI